MATPAQMITALETALAEQAAGVVTVILDGVTTTFNRADARAELDYWQRKAGRAAGTRPVCSTVKLG